MLGEEPVRLDGVLAREGRGARTPQAAPRCARAPGPTQSSRDRALRSFRMAASVRVLTVPTGMLELLGDLRLRAAAEVCQLDHLALLRGKDRESLADLLASKVHVRGLDDVLRRVFVTNRLQVRGPLRAFAEAVLAPHGVHRTVMHERQEERPEGTPRRVVGLGRPPEREEGVLDHLLRERRLGGHPQREAVGRRGVPAVQLVERVPVADRDPPVQLQVEQVVLAHPVFLPHAGYPLH